MTTDYDALEKLARSATPGPWHKTADNDVIQTAHITRDVWYVAYTGHKPKEDSEFIAACNPHRDPRTHSPYPQPRGHERGRRGMKLYFRVPVIFGWLVFHREDQWMLCQYPLLVCHWTRAHWMEPICGYVSKRLFCIGKRGGDWSGPYSEF